MGMTGYFKLGCVPYNTTPMYSTICVMNVVVARRRTVSDLNRSPKYYCVQNKNVINFNFLCIWCCWVITTMLISLVTPMECENIC